MTTSILNTQVFLVGQPQEPIRIEVGDKFTLEEAISTLKDAHQYRHKDYPITSAIIGGIFDTLLAEAAVANLNYVRSIGIQDVTVNYQLIMRKAAPVLAIVDEAPFLTPEETIKEVAARGQTTQLLAVDELGYVADAGEVSPSYDHVQAEHEAVLQAQYQREEQELENQNNAPVHAGGENTPADLAPAGEMNLDGLDALDFDAAEKAAEEKQAGGGEVVEASNECDGGGCKI